MRNSIATSPWSLGFIGRVLTLFLPIALLICASAWLIQKTEKQRLQAEQANLAWDKVQVGVTSVGRTLQSAASDLNYLAHRRANEQLLDNPGPANLSNMAADWSAFAQAKGSYHKIRWIDQNGIERLRVDFSERGPTTVARNELQYKGDRYFFVFASRLDRGQIYVSPLDLNVENGQIEVPYRPTIRFGTPMFASDGTRHGILLTNYSADRLLERFAHFKGAYGDGVWLVNRDGYWLKGDKPDDEFGFNLGRVDLSLKQRNPEIWQRISNASEGQFETEEGLWTFATIFPLKEVEEACAGGPLAITAIGSGTNAEGYYWKAVYLLPADVYSTGIHAFREKAVFVALLLMTLFFAGIWRLVRLHFDETDARLGLERTVEERTRSLRKTNEELSIQQRRMNSLVQNMPNLVWLKSPDGVFLQCNHKFERLFGASENDILGKTDYDFVPKELADFFRDRDQDVIDVGRPLVNEEWVTFADDGHRALLETIKVPVWTNSGKLIGVMGISREITTQRQLEQRLREQEQLLRLFVENAPAAIVMFDREMRYLAVSRRFLEDYPFLGTDVIGRSHYDVFPYMTQEWREFHRRGIAGETIRKEEERIVLPDGRAEWVRWEIKPWYAGGEVGGIVLFTEIITARKEAEEELKMAAMVYRDSSEAMLITDRDGNVVAVNPAFERVTGYSSSEVVGGHSELLISDAKDNEEIYQAIQQELNQTGHWKGELWSRRKNGEAFAALIAINTTLDQDGDVYRRVTLFSDITKKKETEDMIWNQANFDALTGLPNRNLFRDHLGHAIRKARRVSQPLALMFLDLDGFKYVNDTLGHDMGDQLLQEAASRLNSCIRDSDTVARLGGDEFTVILSDLHDPGNVSRIARQILQRLSEPFQLGEEVAHVSASIGITLYPNDATEIEDLLKNADQAMYAAKQSGRNRFQYFTESMQEASQARMRLVNDLRGALGGDQFEVAYQPIIELATGAIFKAEALIRWRHPSRGLISPIEFISIAEDTGMITSFGNWIFEQAANQAAHWREKYLPEFQVSVNISPVQFRNGNIALAAWFDHLRTIDLSGKALVIEITEGLLLEASASVTKLLLALRDAGIEVALDDFGTGYSSLSYLKKFDIDYLKIDQTFVRNLAPGSSDMALCEAIIVMAHKLGLKVIAEGVETEQQRNLLAAAGCDYAQGFLFSGPVSATDFERFLKDAPFMRQESLDI